MNGAEIVGTITISTDVTREMVNDLLTAAFEGGSNYWITNIDGSLLDDEKYFSEHVANGGSIVIVSEDDDVEILTNDVFLKGFESYCKAVGEGVPDVYENHDADIADQILQIALFGEVVYA